MEATSVTQASSTDSKVPGDQRRLGPLSKIPWRYFAVPLICGIVGLFCYPFIRLPVEEVVVVFLLVAIVSVISAGIVASSDLLFMGVQHCQRRGFYKKLVVRRRYIFGLVIGICLGVNMLLTNLDEEGGRIWSSLRPDFFSDPSHQLFMNPVADGLFSKAHSLSEQLYLVNHMFGLEDLCRGIAIGIFIIVVWDAVTAATKAAINYCLPPVDPSELQ
jgi:hypothetical protein